MKKVYLKFILFFILLLIVVIPNNSFAISSFGGYTVESYDIDMVVCDYQPKNYFQAIKGLEHLGEFSQRCYNCYQFRLEEAARYAKKEGFDFSCSISNSLIFIIFILF